MTPRADASAQAIAAAVRSGKTSAVAIVQAALARIEDRDWRLNAFTHVTRERALASAKAVDAKIAAGRDPGPLAGVPFAVKNLFDIEGVVTLAGSKINRGHAPAGADATLVARLEAAGAVLTGALNMGEYAYDFTGENAHVGPSRNPHAPEHMSGGSSGGSAVAVASGVVPLALGSDTNGSIRVPSSLCGLFGLKPTYGRLPRTGTFPFVASLDHLGPFARSTGDLALAYDAMLGYDYQDPACAQIAGMPVSGIMTNGIAGLRIVRASGYFARNGHADAFEAVERVASALGVTTDVEIADAKAARAAAYLITMSEGAALHLDRIREHHSEFDPDVRDRLIAGAMIPGAWVARAQKLRRIFRQRMLQVFESVDAIIAPATPCRAPRIGQRTMTIDGVEMPVRPNLGLFSQPVSFIGFPVVTVPVWTSGERLPIGVQIITAPWREDIGMCIAHWLESRGIVHAPIASGE